MTRYERWTRFGAAGALGLAGAALALAVRPGGPAERILPLDLPVPGDASVELVYVRSATMPLSGEGVPEIRAAARALGATLRVVESEALFEGSVPDADELIAAGATLHFPSLVVFRDGARVGEAILGYKRAAAYRAVVARRLAGAEADPDDGPDDGPDDAPRDARAPRGGAAATGGVRPVRAASMVPSVPSAAGARGRRGAPPSWRDFPVDGRPGPYFKVVPGTDWIVWEMGRRIHLLDLERDVRARAPGTIDFVPSPDGRLFVTPGPAALHFYDARRVLDDQDGGGIDAPLAFADRGMRDQYPSVGILSERGGGRFVTYRILTSWFSGVAYREYEVDWGAPGGAEVRPLGERIAPCPGRDLSIPILSRDGREVAARDEASGTTRVWRIEDDGTCTEVLDLGLRTGKVAFGPTGRRIAFAIPPRAAQPAPGGAGEAKLPPGGEAGVFVLDRDASEIVRVEGSAEVNRLAFPDFLGEDRIVFLVSGSGDAPARFRLVCCLAP